MAVIGGPALADIATARAPALSVASSDGRLSTYSAELPFDLNTGENAAMFTAKIAGDGTKTLPGYDLRFNLNDRSAYTHDLQRAVEVGATWTEGATMFRSSLSQRFGFGVLPRSNYINVSMDVNTRQPMVGPLETAAGVRSALTLNGQSVGALSFAAGAAGDTTVGVSLVRPFSLPTEVSLSVKQTPKEPEDGRVMVKLLKRLW